MSKNRIAWIDVMKFLGIFLIYLGHFGKSAGLSYEFVFTFHVPLFFFISGCTESMSKETKIFSCIKKKTKTILIPFIVFALLSMVLMVISTNSSIGVVLETLPVIFKGVIREKPFCAYSLWFLTCLYIVSIMFIFIKKLKFKPLILAVSLLFFIIAEKVLSPRPMAEPSWIFNIDSAFYYLIYFAVGYIAFPKINMLLRFESIASKIIFCVSGIISLVYSSLLFFKKDLLTFWYTLPYISILKPLITAFIVIWLCICVSFIFKNVKLFNNIGQNTLYLCGSEYIIKLLVPCVAGIFSLKITRATPLSAVIYALILLYIANQTLVPLEKQLINKLTTFKFTKKAPTCVTKENIN